MASRGHSQYSPDHRVRARHLGHRCESGLHAGLHFDQRRSLRLYRTLFTYAYQQAFTFFSFSYAAAIASVMAVVVVGLSIVQIRPKRGPLVRPHLQRRANFNADDGPRIVEYEPVTPGLFGIRTWKKTRLMMACVFGAISVFPLLYMISLSFQPTGDILTSSPCWYRHPADGHQLRAAWSENSSNIFL